LNNLKTGKTTLKKVGTWPETEHVFDQRSIDAIRTAYNAHRPLLIRGEPGVGKSQLARAAAQQTGRLFVSVVVNSRSESSDLHYSFDAIARLADAQAAAALVKDKEEAEKWLSPMNYISPGPLWWVFNYAFANKTWTDSRYKRSRPVEPDNWQQSKGAVILIDEIDKAETDLPNDLLETFGNGAFSVPWLDEVVSMQEQNPPLIVITTNDERELPAAFVRRCVVLHLDLPRDDSELKHWLIERGKAHHGNEFNSKIDSASGEVSLYELSAELLIQNRQKASDQGVPLVGQAEYLDLLRALKAIDKDQRGKALEQISPYVLKKYPEMR